MTPEQRKRLAALDGRFGLDASKELMATMRRIDAYWVARNGARVIATGATASEAVQAAIASGQLDASTRIGKGDA